MKLNDIVKFKIDNSYGGLTKELSVFGVIDYFNSQNESVLVVTNSLYEANIYYDSLLTYTDKVSIFPMDDFLTSVAVAISPDLKNKRLETMDLLKSGKRIVVTNLMGLLRFLPKYTFSEKINCLLKIGVSINRDNFLNVLNSFGYKRESIVTMTGEYAVRGFVIDLFVLGDEHPIRIEFFGDEIESIRYFDEDTQLSLREIEDKLVKPITEIETDDKSSILDYLDNPTTILINKDQIDSGYNKLVLEMFEYKTTNEIDINHRYMFDFNDIKFTKLIEVNNFKNVNFKNIDCRDVDKFNNNLDKLKDFVYKESKHKTIVICLNNKKQYTEISNLIPGVILTNEEYIYVDKINVILKKINNGFVLNDLIVIGANDIDKVKNVEIKYKNNLKVGKKIKDESQLSLGDYIVHMTYGIGIYNGVVTLTKNGLKKDYLQLLFRGNDKIYVPVEKISTLFKHSGKDGTKPKLSKLNSTEWAKTKTTLRKKINDISKELIELYAARANIKGESYVNNEMEELFAADFIYDETNDQLKAMRDIDGDLLSTVPMDRLLCGDVGFGKTEVAFRGIFKALVNDKQVFYLCPTTILSKQQYESALERFKNFPLNIALLNRFTTPKETKKILEGLENGTVDLVFGTHRLLSDDIKFKRLGLLIVDEEQRFGVTHKEKIKKYKNDVNVLTLSATPIPRTLKMALSGLRDLSVIDTAPVNRYPVQTYVMSENDSLIKDAIYKELSRKGQTFVLNNKIDNLTLLVSKLNKMVPEARICYAHGQMGKNELEDTMNAFINHEYDILVSTTIIETGIDIANANTLLIIDADHFGLSQLYQLRGRVGRSNKIAYCYLFYNKAKILSEIAVKRLEAIKEFTELGSGYRIAMRDLSIRGAGDILGSEQAGFVDTVGIELYMKMVDEELRRLKGEEIPEEEDSNKALIEVDTHISDSYVSDEDIKIVIHNKINNIIDFNSLNIIKEELEDRFGKLPSNLLVYMDEEIFEKLALSLGITKVVQTDLFVEVELPKETSSKVKGDMLFLKAHNISSKFSFQYKNEKIYIKLLIANLDNHFLTYMIRLLDEVKYQVDNYN